MQKVAEHIYLIENIWVVLVPLLLGIVSVACLLVGLFWRNRIQLYVSACCFAALLLCLLAIRFFMTGAASS
ncbi:hypothetical protein ACFSO0_09670 [Brevibacillus sp. GCM10020057]|uniref:hypothetical protein n=1 Tax=Brevibacillus sp. GCM10020057 TaxID=3317327 RepID=UPI00362B920B